MQLTMQVIIELTYVLIELYRSCTQTAVSRELGLHAEMRRLVLALKAVQTILLYCKVRAQPRARDKIESSTRQKELSFY